LENRRKVSPFREFQQQTADLNAQTDPERDRLAELGRRVEAMPYATIYRHDEWEVFITGGPRSRGKTALDALRNAGIGDEEGAP
jgi:hypothetical protein